MRWLAVKQENIPYIKRFLKLKIATSLRIFFNMLNVVSEVENVKGVTFEAFTIRKLFTSGLFLLFILRD